MTQWVAEVAVPWLLRAMVVPAWAAYEHSPYLRVAERLRKEEGLSGDEREHRAFLRLGEIVRHANETSPYYRERFRAAGFDPASLRTPEDLKRIPLLTKKDVRENGEGMRSRDYVASRLIAKRTSGSTGVSLHVEADDACMQARRGIALYRDRWTGWDLGEPKAMVWGNPPPRPGIRGRLRRALLERDFYLDTLRMSAPMMRAFAGDVSSRRPTLLFGHAHSLFLFARFWRREGIPPFRFRGIISTAMVLHSFERAEIESVFGSPVFDRYGGEEVSLMASECEAHSGLHVNTDGVWIEILEDPAETRRGLAGKVVVTDLLNRGMPFIRYEVGDRASWTEGPCACRRSYPLLSSVAGRVADYLMAPNGDLVSGISLTENFATLIPGVERVQLIQDRRDHLLVNVVPDPRFGEESRARIAEMVVERFGPAMHHDIALLDHIDPEPSGKYRFSINRVRTD